MKQSVFIFLLLFFLGNTFAQNNISYQVEDGIEYVEKQYLEAWKKVKKIEGFRIQITSFSGANSKTLINNVEAQFKQYFPDISCKITFFEPNYRLRAGNYRTKLEAYKALQKIAPLFQGAFVVKDQIDYRN